MVKEPAKHSPTKTPCSNHFKGKSEWNPEGWGGHGAASGSVGPPGSASPLRRCQKQPTAGAVSVLKVFFRWRLKVSWRVLEVESFQGGRLQDESRLCGSG